MKRCEEWKKKKFDEYFSKDEIDFGNLESELYSDFDSMLEKAGEDGVFEGTSSYLGEKMIGSLLNLL